MLTGLTGVGLGRKHSNGRRLPNQCFDSKNHGTQV